MSSVKSAPGQGAASHRSAGHQGRDDNSQRNRLESSDGGQAEKHAITSERGKSAGGVPRDGLVVQRDRLRAGRKESDEPGAGVHQAERGEGRAV